jgi:CRISPR-associated endonuclease/helicase Cas3
VITEAGLNTVKRMLRQTASKSTAVSCHWIRSRSRSQFLWVVGNVLGNKNVFLAFE